jgi:hypothetical protein
VKKISECINYDYKDYDYEIRICADDWEIKETFQKILKENKSLAKIYDELLNLNITESWKKITHRILFMEYFEDLVYESIGWYNLEKWEYKNLMEKLMFQTW